MNVHRGWVPDLSVTVCDTDCPPMGTNHIIAEHEQCKMGEQMYDDARKLMAAVSKSAGHGLDADDPDDRLTMQNGCYILNSWGFGPMYRFNLYFRGPYSVELDDDHRSLGNELGGTTDVPDEAAERLSEIFGKGLSYAEAYTTVLLVKNNSPGASYSSIHKRALELKPYLSKEVEEACFSILV